MPFTQDEVTTNLLRNNEPLPIPPQNLRVKTWFLENQRGEIVAVDEDAAWHMLQPAQGIGLQKVAYRIAGVSYAQVYAKAVEDMNKDKTLTPEQKKEILRKAFDDEVVEARKHVEYPRNPNMKDIEGKIQTDPRVLSQLPK